MTPCIFFIGNEDLTEESYVFRLSASRENKAIWVQAIEGCKKWVIGDLNTF